MVIKRDILYPPKGTMRTLHIYLPDDYAESGKQYPVMYFFDGHNLYRDEDATYGKSWGLEAFLTDWEKEMIIVGMECSHVGDDRLDEYSPYTFPSFFTGTIHGIGDDTMKWIVNDIKPMIDREYPTYPFREATGIGGSSMGGLMAVYAAAKYNSVFSKAACLSSAHSRSMPQLCWDIVSSNIDADTRVFLSWGTEEAGGKKQNPDDDLLTTAGRNNQAAASLFRQQFADARLYCQRGGHHCEADWEKQVPLFMNYLWLEG